VSHETRHLNVRTVRTASLVTLAALAVGGGAVTLARKHGGGVVAASATELGPFRLGEEIRNRAQLALTLEMGAGAAPQALELEADVTATVTDIRDGLAQMGCELANIKTSMRQDQGGAAAQVMSPSLEAERAMAAELGRRFYVSYRADGAAAGVWFPRGLNPSIANILLTVAGANQLVRPAKAGQAWIVRERDVNGEYTAAYQETAPGRYTKQKAAYLQAVRGAAAGAPAGKTGEPAIRVERSKATLTATATGRVLELDQTEVLALDLGTSAMSFRVTSHVVLGGGRAAQAPDRVGAFARERATLEFQSMEQMGMDPKAEVARLDRALLGGASLDELLVALSALPADAKAGPRESAVSGRLEAEFRLHPESAARAPVAIRGQTPDRAKLLVDALLLAGTPAAHAALGAVAKDAAAGALPRQYAIQYIGQLDEPAAPVVAALRGLLDDGDAKLRQISRLAYGACARKLRTTAPARKDAIVAELLRRFGAEKDEGLRADLVVALGNAGDVAAFSVLRGLADGGSPRLRGRAIGALRFLDDPAVDPLILSLLGNAADENVRLSAIGAIRYREVGPFTIALADVAKTDKVETVRQAAVDLLGSRLRQLPALRPVLEYARAKDPAPRIRELAARHLGATSG